VVEYLSPAWLDSIRTELAARDGLAAAAAGQTVGFTQEITDGATYHVAVAEGRVTVGWGPAHPEHVRLRTDRRTAVAVARGALNAQEAFITGHLVLTGDQQHLLAVQPVLLALDEVMQSINRQTSYADA
jgi:hypothetical protein